MHDNFMTYQECIVKFLSNFNDYVNTKYVLNKDRLETREEMEIPEDTEFEKYSAVARLS